MKFATRAPTDLERMALTVHLLRGLPKGGNGLDAFIDLVDSNPRARAYFGPRLVNSVEVADRRLARHCDRRGA